MNTFIGEHTYGPWLLLNRVALAIAGLAFLAALVHSRCETCQERWRRLHPSA